MPREEPFASYIETPGGFSAYGNPGSEYILVCKPPLLISRASLIHSPSPTVLISILPPWWCGLQMLAWRVTHYTSEGVEIRLRNCNRMFKVLDAALAGRNQFGKEAKESSTLFARAKDVLPGIWAHRHTLWLYPVMIRGGSGRAADDIVDALVDEGFDATRSPTSLMSIDR